MKRLLLTAAATACLVWAPAAFAHTTSLTGSSVCVNGAPVITWVWVASDPAKTPRVLETSNTAIPVGSAPGGFTQLTTEAASATIKVRWSDGYTATTSASVPKPGSCALQCPIPPPVEKIVYVDRPVDRVVEKRVEVPVDRIVEKPVERVVTRTVTKVKRVQVVRWKTRTVVQWRTRYVPCSADKNWNPITRKCVPKTPTG